jgi:NTP pyrophosphatase (non-canonical NTP hydrolase)
MDDSSQRFNNPWHPMTDPVAVKVLGKLGEEAGELSSAICRCIIQGIAELHPYSGKSNTEWLEEEIADVLAGIELTCDQFGLDETKIAERMQAKKIKLAVWHKQA